jgi:hypothetical protein
VIKAAVGLNDNCCSGAQHFYIGDGCNTPERWPCSSWQGQQAATSGKSLAAQCVQGLPIGQVICMDDGKDGVIPFQSKSPAATGGKEVASLPTLSDGHHHVVNLMDGKGNLTLQKESGRKLLLQLSGLQSGTGFELTDQLGNVVYRNALHPQANSVETRIDLSTETCGLYFLRVYSPAGSRTFAVMMN